MLIHFPQACHTHFVSPEHASLTLRKRGVEFHFFYIVEEIQVLLMVLGKIFKSALRDLSPDIPALPTVQGSSCVSSSGCACAILGLSFPVASRAGVFHGTRELPGSTLPPPLCSTLVSGLSGAARTVGLFPYPSFPIA